jgi:hypothetical protein
LKKVCYPQLTDQLKLIAHDMKTTQHRVVYVQRGYVLDHQRRIRVIDDFETSYQTTLAEAISTDAAAAAIICAMQIRFGAQKIIENGVFHEQGVGLRYKVPKERRDRSNPNIVSEPQEVRP